MEIVLEILLEIFVEGTFFMAKSDKTPRLLKIIIFLTIISGMLALFYLAYTMRSHWQFMWMFIILGSMLALFLISPIVRHLRSIHTYHEE